MRRSQYESSAASIDALIAARKAKGVPTDDLVDWQADVAAIVGQASTARDRDALRDLFERALAIVNGGLRSLPPYVDDEGLSGIEVRLRALSKADCLDMRADLAACAYDGDDASKRLRSSAATQRAVRPFLDKCLAGVRGVPLENGNAMDADGLEPGSPTLTVVLDVLDASGILGAVFGVARDYQDLPVPQRGRFGLPQAATSLPSIAVPAQPAGESYSAVTAAPLGDISRATLIERPIGVLDVTSSTTLGLATHSTSTASAEVSPV